MMRRSGRALRWRSWEREQRPLRRNRTVVRVIDMHNHLVAPEVVAFLEREGTHYNTRIIEQDGQRFFIIQDTARRPLHARITQVDARLSAMDAEGVDIQAMSWSPFVMYAEVSESW